MENTLTNKNEYYGTKDLDDPLENNQIEVTSAHAGKDIGDDIFLTVEKPIGNINPEGKVSKISNVINVPDGLEYHQTNRDKNTNKLDMLKSKIRNSYLDKTEEKREVLNTRAKNSKTNRPQFEEKREERRTMSEIKKNPRTLANLFGLLD